MVAVLDTNHFRELRENSEVGQRLQSRIESPEVDTFTTIVTAEEALSGWVAFIRRHRAGLDQLNGYERLHTCIETLSKLAILPFDREAALTFHELDKLRPRIGTMDLKIAAICLAHDALLLSRNLVDFEKVPGLRVENWLDP